MRAYLPVIRAYLARGAWCWFAARLVLSAARWMGQLPPLRVSTTSAFEIAVVAAGLSFLETGLRRERWLVGNLAIHPALLATCFIVAALAGEAILRVVLSA